MRLLEVEFPGIALKKSLVEAAAAAAALHYIDKRRRGSTQPAQG